MNVLLRTIEDTREGAREPADFVLKLLAIGAFRLENRHKDRTNGALLLHPILPILIFGQLSQANPRPSGSCREDFRGRVGELRCPTGLNPLTVGQNDLHIKKWHIDHRVILDEDTALRRLR